MTCCRSVAVIPECGTQSYSWPRSWPSLWASLVLVCSGPFRQTQWRCNYLISWSASWWGNKIVWQPQACRNVFRQLWRENLGHGPVEINMVNFWTGMSQKIEAFQLANTSIQKRPDHLNISLDQDSRIGFVVRQSLLWGLSNFGV